MLFLLKKNCINVKISFNEYRYIMSTNEQKLKNYIECGKIKEVCIFLKLYAEYMYKNSVGFENVERQCEH